MSKIKDQELDLHDAYMIGADLRNVNLSGAHLRGADLEGAIMDDPQEERKS